MPTEDADNDESMLTGDAPDEKSSARTMDSGRLIAIRRKLDAREYDDPVVVKEVAKRILESRDL